MGTATAGCPLRDLHYFWVVTNGGDFARAAERLHVAVPALRWRTVR